MLLTSVSWLSWAISYSTGSLYFIANYGVKAHSDRSIHTDILIELFWSILRCLLKRSTSYSLNFESPTDKKISLDFFYMDSFFYFSKASLSLHIILDLFKNLSHILNSMYRFNLSNFYSSCSFSRLSM